jgi:hypothetical protein
MTERKNEIRYSFSCSDPALLSVRVTLVLLSDLFFFFTVSVLF